MVTRKNEDKQDLAAVISNMIAEGSEGVTTLSSDPEAKYESIAEKEPGKKDEKVNRKLL